MENLPITVILADDKLQFKKEQNELLKTILEYRFFNPWKSLTANKDLRSLQHDSNVELFITNKCNQDCSYCYLTKYPNLYPNGNDPKTILKNLDILYDYFITNRFFIPEIDMFSGEIWHTQLGFDIFDHTIDAIRRGLQFDHILIASNCSFVNDPKTLQRIQNYIDTFNNMGCPLKFSISVDGKYIDNMGRPRNSKEEYTDEFYDNLFAFAKHNTFYFHPMLAASNIKYWPENWEWWKKMHKYYCTDVNKMMMLEVRNNDWTDEAIQQYCDFLVKMADDFLHDVCHDNIEMLANMIGNVRTANMPALIDGYVPWAINQTDNFMGCSIDTHLTIRLGDLAICPCHRTAYDKYLYGKFVVEDDMIVDIEARNPQMAIKTLMGNLYYSNPKCDTCLYKSCCLKGCYGSQLETVKDPFFPIDCVCKLFEAKYSRILQYYKDKGIIDYYKSFSTQEFGADKVAHIIQLYENWEAQKNGLGTC